MFELDFEGDVAGCVNHGCVNRFAPAVEGWNGECDPCAARAADHFDGVHGADELDCLLCLTGIPQAHDRDLAIAA
jgi:hypothetical protein